MRTQRIALTIFGCIALVAALALLDESDSEHGIGTADDGVARVERDPDEVTEPRVVEVDVTERDELRGEDEFAPAAPEPFGWVIGYVFDPEGRGIAGARVRLIDSLAHVDPGGDHEGGVRATTDELGRFELISDRDLASGHTYVNVVADGFDSRQATFRDVVVAQSRAQGSTLIELVLSRSGWTRIEGHFILEDGSLAPPEILRRIFDWDASAIDAEPSPSEEAARIQVSTDESFEQTTLRYGRWIRNTSRFEVWVDADWTTINITLPCTLARRRVRASPRGGLFVLSPSAATRRRA